MAWNAQFNGIREEVILEINQYDFPADAYPTYSVRQFIANQLPTPTEDAEMMQEFTVDCAGSLTDAAGLRTIGITVNVTRGAVRVPVDPAAEQMAIQAEQEQAVVASQQLPIPVVDTVPDPVPTPVPTPVVDPVPDPVVAS